MQVAALEQLSERLHRLRQQLDVRRRSGTDVLTEDDDLVLAAKECDFMLPEQLSVSTLAETVDRKIANVTLLLDRARKHEDLPDAAKLAADQEYTLTEEDYLVGKSDTGGVQGNSANVRH